MAQLTWIDHWKRAALQAGCAVALWLCGAVLIACLMAVGWILLK